MNQLQIINKSGRLLVDSRDVAEMVDRPHNDLMKSIRNYMEHLTKGAFSLSEFFIESTYQDGTGRTLPCFLLTRKGCDMVANKMPGEKGTLFTAAYVSRFEEYEQAGRKTDLSNFSPLLQMLIQTEQRQNELEERQDNTDRQFAIVKETLLARDEDWRNKMTGLLNGAVMRRGTSYRDMRTLSYQMLEQRGHCDLDRRLTNLKERLRESGATKTKVEEANRLDVIEAEPRLKEIYTTIVKELSIGAMN
ncbi:Rha family transcriptional regulator [Paenibacillus sp. IHBB 3054]|uniref:Rha family transcriptional regulator n=1 Tax=Paenibacillus sp. IHBB 3054 TaxID=3425689 RepID=UPI003F667770